MYSETHFPYLPERLNRLGDLAYNLWFSWNTDAINLFRKLDRKIWRNFMHNPVRLLHEMDPLRLNHLSENPSFLEMYDNVVDKFDRYMSDKDTWYNRTYPEHKNKNIAYLSMEFGFHESMPIYSGGLGILAGDHLKTASDMGIPMIGIGLLYRVSYFTQFITRQGDQQAVYQYNDFSSLGAQLVKDQNGNTLTIHIPMDHRNLAARVWIVQVGRIPLYLLDTDFPENSNEDRKITERLYVADRDNRLLQEMLLGMGGVLALKTLGIEPAVWHMNEGHSGFLTVERIRQLKPQIPLNESVEIVKKSNVFTTHTPVPAGNETFESDRIEKWMSEILKSMNISRKDFFSLGHFPKQHENDPFNMTIFALKTSRTANGVSRLHGEVARKMWKELWPDLSENNVPITSITNGVHPHTWMTNQIQKLFDEELGKNWRDNLLDKKFWKGIESIPGRKLWDTHIELKTLLIEKVRGRAAAQRERNGESHAFIRQADNLFNPDYLTIGFARRFAPYKRASLLMRDIGRLQRMLCNPERPVQIIFAGKAHPADEEGKGLIRYIYEICGRPEFQNNMILVENYDMILSRRLISGVDVWLNTPRRPMEASGTSGMKVAFNGGLNFSILDGWWCEGYKPESGWAIGKNQDYSDYNHQDHEDAESLYHLLENEIIPAYYNRDKNDIPVKWIEMMKSSMADLIPRFNTYSMLEEYIKILYNPCLAEQRVK